MSDWYTITGKVTGRDYLVVLNDYAHYLYHPNNWNYTPTLGVSYQVGSSTNLVKNPLWLTDLFAKWLVRKEEKAVLKKHNKAKRLERFAKKKSM